LPHLEKGYHESLIIVLDTLEQCLSLQAHATNPGHRGAAARVHGEASVLSAAVIPASAVRDTAPTPKHDEVMNVKLLLKEICQFLDMPNDSSNMVNQIRNLASKVLFALSVNNFGAVFSRISSRLQELSVSNDENPDHTDIELIQHIDVDLQRLTKLLTEAISKFKSLKKSAYLALMNSLEKAIWNWMHNYRK
jgi:neurofibromin 1